MSSWLGAAFTRAAEMRSDRRFQTPDELSGRSSEKSFLNLPVGAAKRRMELATAATRSADIELAAASPTGGPRDIRPFRGSQAVLRVDAMQPARRPGDQPGPTDKGRNALRRTARPQFHFSQQRGWNNDPNGACLLRRRVPPVLPLQPHGWGWANMHWGHAVSRDLVHWEQLPEPTPTRPRPIASRAAEPSTASTAAFKRARRR